MKKLFYSAIISLGVLFASCDYVSNPYPVKNANVSSDTANCPTTFPVATTHVKNILVEDYTGHICPNCPKAAIALTSIDSTYPGRIVPVAVHCSGLAAPSPGYEGSPATAFLPDYRTNIGTTFDNFFGASAYGLPEGMFNRINFNPLNPTAFANLYSPSSFASMAATIINESSVVDLQININYDAPTQKVSCSIRDSFLTVVTGNYNLCLFLTQDSIIDWQADGTTVVQNYVFNHMFRDAITPEWGQALVGGSASAGETQIRHFAYTIPAAYSSPVANSTPIPCVAKHCHIVAFIYNTATYEIIQSAMYSIP